MSVQKIMNTSSRKTKFNPLKPKSSNTPINKTERNDVSLEKSEALKNSLLGGISFKGYTRDFTYEEIYNSSGEIVDCKIPTSSGQIVIRGAGATDRPKHGRAQIWYASSGETLTDEIMRKYDRIVIYEQDKNRGIIQETPNKNKSYTGYEKLSNDVSVSSIKAANDTSALRSIIAQLEKREREIRSKLYGGREEKKHIDHWRQVASNRSWDTWQEYNNASTDEEIYLAKHELELAEDELAEMNEKQDKIYKEIDILTKYQEENNRKLQMAREKLERIL